MNNSRTLGDAIKKVSVSNASKKIGDGDIISNLSTEKQIKIDRFGRAYATGRRKVASARVWIKKGTGKILINNRPFEDYFRLMRHRLHILEPMLKLNIELNFDVIATVSGGGITGQAGAVRHGISRALDNYAPTVWHTILAQDGFLTRDSRMVESKKYGMRGARKKVQFSKR